MKYLLVIVIASLIALCCENEVKNKKEDLEINFNDKTEILNTINNVYNNIEVASNKKPVDIPPYIHDPLFV